MKKILARLKEHGKEFRGEQGHFGKHYGFAG
jgi:hypothetical protein